MDDDGDGDGNGDGSDCLATIILLSLATLNRFACTHA